MAARPLDTVFIANRGEIALRVIRTLRARGIASVAAFHAVDAGRLYVHEADRAIELKAIDARSAYLDVEQVVAAAKQAGAQAIHPGYGFLSEQARFAQACEDAGLIFLGPRAETLAALGDKKSARQAARDAGLPVAPGWEGQPLGGDGKPTKEAVAAANKLGYPLLIKAVLGGGGKGMHEARSAADLDDAIASAAREALSSFGDAAVYMERRLEPVRHVEVQFAGDGKGGVVHLFERECSLQRRHQKVIEEAPAARMTPALRKRLTDAAKAIAKHVKYRGVGTAEFLVDEGDGVHFLEVNARIQVEHPVTELVTGLDLVGVQLDVALGRALPDERKEPHGHAIEARLYAEDPAHDFLPQSGRIAALRLPSGPGVRVDSGLREGDVIGMDFDPMIAKISAWGEDRAQAVARLKTALAETMVAGVLTNLSFLRALAADAEFAAGRTVTSHVESHVAPAWRAARRARGASPAVLAAAAIALAEAPANLGAGGDSGANGDGAPAGPWTTLGGFRVGGDRAR